MNTWEAYCLTRFTGCRLSFFSLCLQALKWKLWWLTWSCSLKMMRMVTGTRTKHWPFLSQVKEAIGRAQVSGSSNAVASSVKHQWCSTEDSMRPVWLLTVEGSYVSSSVWAWEGGLSSLLVCYFYPRWFHIKGQDFFDVGYYGFLTCPLEYLTQDDRIEGVNLIEWQCERNLGFLYQISCSSWNCLSRILNDPWDLCEINFNFTPISLNRLESW